MGKSKKTKDATGSDGELRLQAEKRVGAGGWVPVAEDATLPAQRLVHELQVHQIELEMQNEEITRTRAMAEERLARYTELYDLAPVGYLTVSRDRTIRQMNLTGARLLGYERSRLVGRPLVHFCAVEHHAALNTFLADAFASRAPGTCEVVLRSEKAEPRTVELVATAATDGQECRVTVTDITERKRVEQERTELQMELWQARKMEAIGTLAGGIAHDFNNILGGMLCGLSLLEMKLGESSEDLCEVLEMKALVNRGADLTKQLLGFACRGKYDVKPLDITIAAKKTCMMFGRAHKEITIKIDLAPGLCAVLMDHSQLEQVLLNLLINAAQAMPEGGRIELSAQNVELGDEQAAPHGIQPGRFVKLVVTDTGAGMDSATQSRIFEPFFTTKGQGQGTGLGLASVYGIIKNHAGLITVDSELRKGTTFTLLLPATELPVVVEQNAKAVAIPRGSGTILVVDDEEQILRVYTRALKKIGYDVLAASGGKQALELMRQHKDDVVLVILDMIMPEMSGRQTFDALQEIAPGTKVLLSTGYSLDTHAQELLEQGCNGFLQKPFDAASLAAKLQEIL